MESRTTQEQDNQIKLKEPARDKELEGNETGKQDWVKYSETCLAYRL